MRRARLLPLPLLLPLLLAPPAHAATYVDAGADAFVPRRALAETWTEVTWTFGEVAHGVVADDGGTWCEPRANATCSRVFTQPGEFPYHCPLHPEMRGVVAVQRRGGELAPSLRALWGFETDGLLLRVNASESARSGTAIARYEWDWGDGANGTGRVAEHEYARAGTYNVTLRVVDETGRDARNVRVVRVAPFPSNMGRFTATPSGLLVAVEAQPLENVTSWRWDLGDGTRLACTLDGCGTPPEGTFVRSPLSLLHAYLRPGEFSVVRSWEVEGTRRASGVHVRVPGDGATPFRVEAEGLDVRLDASGIRTYGAALYRWRFGDGGNATGAVVEHRFPGEGLWSVELELVDSGGVLTARADVPLPQAARPAAPAPTPREAPASGPPAALAALAVAAALHSSRRRT